MSVVSRIESSKSTVLWVGGAITSVVSLAVCLLVLFRPVACSFVTSLQLVIWGVLFIAGVLATISGLVLSRR